MEYVRAQKNNHSIVSDDRQGYGCTAHTENDKYSNFTKCTHRSVSSDYLRVMGLEYLNSLFFCLFVSVGVVVRTSLGLNGIQTAWAGLAD